MQSYNKYLQIEAGWLIGQGSCLVGEEPCFRDAGTGDHTEGNHGVPG